VSAEAALNAKWWAAADATHALALAAYAGGIAHMARSGSLDLAEADLPGFIVAVRVLGLSMEQVREDFQSARAAVLGSAE
jgi:hypothetical protein